MATKKNPATAATELKPKRITRDTPAKLAAYAAAGARSAASRPGNRTRQEVMTDICALLAGGDSLNGACRTLFDAPAPNTILDWTKAYPELGEQYARAREIGYKLMADKIVEISDEPIPSTESGSTDSGAVAHQRLRIDTRKWMLSKVLPKIYGDRLETVLSGSLEVTQPIDQVRLELATLLKNNIPSTKKD